MDDSSHCSTMLILWKIWIVHGSTNDFHSISDKKGKGNMLDLFFSTVDGCATRRTTGYKVVYPLGTSVCNIVKKTNGTCEVLCQNFFIGRQQVNLCRTMSRVARFACNQHFSQVRCIHTHACAWSRWWDEFVFDSWRKKSFGNLACASARDCYRLYPKPCRLFVGWWPFASAAKPE